MMYKFWNRKKIIVLLLFFIIFYIVSGFMIIIINQNSFFIFYLSVWFISYSGMISTALILYSTQKNKKNCNPDDKTKIKDNEKQEMAN